MDWSRLTYRIIGSWRYAIPCDSDVIWGKNDEIDIFRRRYIGAYRSHPKTLFTGHRTLVRLKYNAVFCSGLQILHGISSGVFGDLNGAALVFYVQIFDLKKVVGQPGYRARPTQFYRLCLYTVCIEVGYMVKIGLEFYSGSRCLFLGC